MDDGEGEQRKIVIPELETTVPKNKIKAAVKASMENNPLHHVSPQSKIIHDLLAENLKLRAALMALWEETTDCGHKEYFLTDETKAKIRSAFGLKYDSG